MNQAVIVVALILTLAHLCVIVSILISKRPLSEKLLWFLVVTSAPCLGTLVWFFYFDDPRT